MEILEVRNLCKKYEKFQLHDISFSLKKGAITGFIGRNGAGKTTTLKSLLNLVHADSGEIHFFGTKLSENEIEIKQKVGFVSGGVNYYPKKKLKTITQVTKSFYSQWDQEAYNRYLDIFQLDPEKTPDQLSEGMKVKYSIALALSHHATLLILDEPTSGLDPVSRDELLDVFMDLVQKEDVTILFSTHITSDLEKCASEIIYIKEGAVLAATEMDEFIQRYKIVKVEEGTDTEARKKLFIGCRRNRNGYTALVKREEAEQFSNLEVSDASLESIMIHMEKE